MATIQVYNVPVYMVICLQQIIIYVNDSPVCMLSGVIEWLLFNVKWAII